MRSIPKTNYLHSQYRLQEVSSHRSTHLSPGIHGLQRIRPSTQASPQNSTICLSNEIVAQRCLQVRQRRSTASHGVIDRTIPLLTHSQLSQQRRNQTPSLREGLRSRQLT